jgi:hypothetical protein
VGEAASCHALCATLRGQQEGKGHKSQAELRGSRWQQHGLCTASSAIVVATWARSQALQAVLAARRRAWLRAWRKLARHA